MIVAKRPQRVALRELLAAHPLPAFFGLTFVLSWSIWVPLALDHVGWLPLDLSAGVVSVIRLFGTLGPALAATIVALLQGGRSAEGALWRQLGRWRVSWRWYVAAGLVFPTLLFVMAGAYRLLPAAGPLPFQAVSAGSLVTVGLILVVSVLGEEVGWRGFALPRLQERWTALKASLLLGAIWTVWHLPFWVVLGELEQFGPAYWLLSWAFITAGAIYLTWLMNNTGNSLLVAVLFHWSLNIVSVGYLPLTTVVPAYILFTAASWIIALVLLALFGARRLRKRP